MDLIRKMSGLRSSQDLSAAVERSKKEDAAAEDKWGEESSDREENGEEEEDNDHTLHDAEQDDGDVFEDAAAALGQQPQRHEEEQPDSNGRSDGEEAPAGASPIRVRPDDADGAKEDDNEDEDEDEDEDGRGSHGSGESFDSALERMAASSEAGYDPASSPKMTSPVGSLQHAHTIMLGNPPTVALSPSQQGALIRLNELITGDSSLDTSVIENSTREEFKSRVTRLAHSRGQSEEDLSFVSIVDALLPLVPEKATEEGDEAESKGPQSSLPKAKLFADDDESDGNEEKVFENGTLENGGGHADEEKAEVNGEEEEVLVDELSKQPPSPMPNAKLAAEDNYDGEELQLSDQEDNAENVTLENGGEEKQAAEVQGQPEIAERESIVRSDSAEKPPIASSNSVPDSNGGHDDSSGNAAAMPMAKLSAEDEDVIEERDDDEEPEEDMDEPVEETAGEATEDENFPLKIRALPSDLDDNVSSLHADFGSTKLETGENVNNDEDSLPAKVPSKEAEEIQTIPVAKVSDDDAHSPVNHVGVQSTSPDVLDAPDVPQVASIALPTDLSVDTEGPEGPSEGVPANDTEALGQVSEKSAGDEAVKGGEATKIPSIALPTDESEENGGDEVETFMSNLDDAEEIDGEDEEDEDHEEEDEDDEDGHKERSDALAALLRSAESRPAAGAGATPSLGSAGPSLPARPTRTVRSSLPSLEPAFRPVQQSRSSEAIRSSNPAEEAANSEPDGNEETREKLQSIRVKFLRLALRLGQSAHNVVVAQVLYRLGLAEQLRGGRSNRPNTAFSFDRASSIAEEQERAGPEELDFACTIMMLGKTGVGKSATINSIFDEAKTGTNAFSPATNKVQVVTGHVHGIKVRVIDTPGLLPSVVDQRHNEKIMASVKGFIKKQSPDIVLYFDRLDMQSRDYGDLPLLRTITDTFGAAVWFNAIVVLTHASSAPPDGPNGLPLSYEMFVAQRSHVVQQTIRQAAGDMRLMNPVSLVENHRACRVNRSGDRVLPNGQVWKPQLLLLCFASKILAEANSLLKLQDNTPGKPFGQRSRVPPLPFLLSSLLQSRAPLKLPDEEVGDDDESDEELEEEDDSEDEEDYDQLPPFRRLAKEEIAELDEVNRAQYFEELAERERLFQKKQWKEELKRRKEMKKRMAETQLDQSPFGDEGLEEDMARSAAVPVPMPDMVLPPSFDSDNPSHRYRYLETANQWLVRPVLETHGWDHDNGYDGMSVEKMFVIKDKIPTSVSGQITKDKKEANLNMEAAASLKHGEGKVTMAGLDVQTVGKDLAYTLRSDTRFSNFKGNKTTGGLAVTLLGDTLSAGMKIEDRLLVGKRVKLVVNGGAITGGGDVAYGGSLEATLRDQEYPLSRTLSTLGVSIMDWHGDLAVGGNLQSQFILGKTMMVGRANINNRGAGQISIRASSSEQLQMALIGILPIVRAIVSRLFGQSE